MLQTNTLAAAADRHARILDAAETCFVRAGFHRTTMQDVAAEAGMSAGNLYRYFPSKEAIVDGLSERDRRDIAESFAALETSGGDFMEAFAALGQRHFADEPREKAVLCLEIWAEATRNPEFQARTAALAAEIVDRLTAIFETARRSGAIAPRLESRVLATVICTMADGLFVRRAVLPDFDPEREIPPIMAVIGALVAGDAPSCRPTHAEAAA